MNRSTQCCVGAAALAGAVFLAGCSALASAPSESNASREGAATQAPQMTPSPTADQEEATGIPVDLTFEAGADLNAATVRAEWWGSIESDPDFAVLSADDGNGSWSFTDVTNECRIIFYQGSLFDVEEGPDDRTTSMDVIARIRGPQNPDVTVSIVEEYGTEFPVAQSNDTGTVAFWGLGGQEPGGPSFVDSARYFKALDKAQYVSVSCPASANAYEEHDKLFNGGYVTLRIVDHGG
jgi:hypothetical protein